LLKPVRLAPSGHAAVSTQTETQPDTQVLA
jgi:hypothetical protein